MSVELPRVLVIDDLFGRHLPNGSNDDRDNLCASFMLRDVTGEVLPARTTVSRQKLKFPIAEAVFIRGQTPDCPSNGDEVQNDLEGTLQIVKQLWAGPDRGFKRLSLLLLDLCFYTGFVTGKISSAVGGSGYNKAESGMPEGRAEDVAPKGFFGLKLLKAIHALYPDLPIVILSSQDRDQVSREYSAHGALGFLPRTAPNGDEQLRTLLDRHGLLPEPHGLIVGNSLPLMKALRAVRRTAYKDSRDNILIRGERGVGKEEFARYIHRVHPTRARKDIISVNSAVLTSGLYVSELFGIEKRKATGVDKHDGAVIRAHQGDLFLDEVKDMIPEAQAAVLRFLEEGTFTPTGAKEEREVDVRVISATNADLGLYAATSRFREDLLDRLQRGGTIYLPPLRDRKDDIALLAESFLRKAEAEVASASKGSGTRLLRRHISDEALTRLMEYDWPGNIRVLRDVISKIVKDNDVEFVYPVHIEKASQGLGAAQLTTAPASVAVTVPALEVAQAQSIVEYSVDQKKETHREVATMSTIDRSSDSAHTLSSLIATINDFDFDLSNPELLYNHLDVLDEAAAKLVARYLLASLRLNRNHATGEPEVTKGIKFATGRQALTTSAAYDVIKRLLKRNDTVREWALKDPLLRQAYDQAESTRVSNRGKKSR